MNSKALNYNIKTSYLIALIYQFFLNTDEKQPNNKDIKLINKKIENNDFNKFMFAK